MNFQHIPHLALLVNATLWGISWIPYKALEDLGLSILLATGLAYGLLCLAAAAMVWPSVKGFMGRHPLWPMALAYGLTNTCFNWALATGEVVRVVLLFFLMPLWSALFARAMLGMALGPAGWARIALALLGLATMLALPAVLAGENILASLGFADLLAVLGGMAFGLGNVLLRRAAAATAAERVFGMFIGSVLSPIVLLMLVAPGLAIFAPDVPLPSALAVDRLGEAMQSPTAWAIVLGLTAGLAVANLCLQFGASRLAPPVASVFMLFEVLVATASSALLLGRTLTPLEWLGGAMILAAAVWASREGDHT